MGKRFDSLLAAVQSLVNDAICNEEDYRAEARARGVKMADLLGDQIGEVVDLELELGGEWSSLDYSGLGDPQSA